MRFVRYAYSVYLKKKNEWLFTVKKKKTFFQAANVQTITTECNSVLFFKNITFISLMYDNTRYAFHKNISLIIINSLTAYRVWTVIGFCLRSSIIFIFIIAVRITNLNYMFLFQFIFARFFSRKFVEHVLRNDKSRSSFNFPALRGNSRWNRILKLCKCDPESKGQYER